MKRSDEFFSKISGLAHGIEWENEIQQSFVFGIVIALMIIVASFILSW